MSSASPALGRALLGWSLVAAVAGLVAVAAMAASAPDAVAQDSQLEGTPVEASVQNGNRLYAQYCATCHGAGGAGGAVPRYGGQAPALDPEANPNVTVPYLDLVMSTGRMPPAGSPYDNRTRQIVLDEAERADILAFMAAEFGVEGETPDVGEGEAARGQEVYARNCAQCHGSTGAGGVAGAGAWTPSVSDASAETIAEAIRVGPFNMPRFERGQISEDEVADVVAFLRAVEEEPTTPILGLVELNPVYASGFVALFALAMLLSIVWIGGRPAWFPDPPKGSTTPDVPAGARRRSGASAADAPPEEIR